MMVAKIYREEMIFGVAREMLKYLKLNVVRVFGMRVAGTWSSRGDSVENVII